MIWALIFWYVDAETGQTIRPAATPHAIFANETLCNIAGQAIAGQFMMQGVEGAAFWGWTCAPGSDT